MVHCSSPSDLSSWSKIQFICWYRTWLNYSAPLLQRRKIHSQRKQKEIDCLNKCIIFFVNWKNMWSCMWASFVAASIHPSLLPSFLIQVHVGQNPKQTCKDLPIQVSISSSSELEQMTEHTWLNRGTNNKPSWQQLTIPTVWQWNS